MLQFQETYRANCPFYIGKDPVPQSDLSQLEKKLEEKLAKITLTFTASLRAEVSKEKKEVLLKFEGAPFVSLNHDEVFKPTQIGPFIEEVAYKVTSKKASIIRATPPGTPTETYQVSHGNTLSVNAGTSDCMGRNVALNINNGPNANGQKNEFSETSSSENQTVSLKKRLIGSKAKKAADYDPKDPETLFNFTNIFSINLYKSPFALPEAAKGSIEFSPSATYQKLEKNAFKIELIATTVFAYHAGTSFEMYNCYKTKHILAKEIEVSEEGKIQDLTTKYYFENSYTPINCGNIYDTLFGQISGLFSRIF